VGILGYERTHTVHCYKDANRNHQAHLTNWKESYYTNSISNITKT